MIRLEKIITAPSKPDVNKLMLTNCSAAEIVTNLQAFVDSFQYNFSGAELLKNVIWVYDLII